MWSATFRDSVKETVRRLPVVSALTHQRQRGFLFYFSKTSSSLDLRYNTVSAYNIITIRIITEMNWIIFCLHVRVWNALLQYSYCIRTVAHIFIILFIMYMRESRSSYTAPYAVISSVHSVWHLIIITVAHQHKPTRIALCKTSETFCLIHPRSSSAAAGGIWWAFQ